MKCYLILLLCFCKVSIIFCQSADDIQLPSYALTAGKMSSVVNLKINGGTLSGFLFRDSTDKVYLATARHAFENVVTKTINKKVVSYRQLLIHNSDTVKISVKKANLWEEHSGTVYFHRSMYVDIAVVKLNLPGPSAVYQVPNTDGWQLFGQEVYFFGFPFCYIPYAGAPDFQFPHPLVKKGAFSGSNLQADGTECLFIDGNNTYGFSGGPVIYYDYKLKRYQLMGVVSGYVPQTNEVIYPDGTSSAIQENSGIVVVSPAKYINEIIKSIAP